MNKATWIWYPGDFSIALFNKTMLKRYERDLPIPPFWRMDYFYPDVKFIKEVEISQPEALFVKAEGLLSVQIDGVYQYGVKSGVTVPAGKHLLCFWVYNNEKLPCLFVKGKTINTDNSWTASCNDHDDKKAESWNFDTVEKTPNDFALDTKIVYPVKKIQSNGKTIYDFGREMMAYVNLSKIKGKGNINIFYGESLEEALDEENCELTDCIFAENEKVVTPIAKAFRYLNIQSEVEIGEISALFEYLPIECKSSFISDDIRLNKIYNTAIETLHLNTREFFLDGIKRDRWVWGGDAYQSYLMNFYSFYDVECVKRTMYALAGKEPYKTHINHIMDYTFYWIIAAVDVYKFTQSAEIIELFYQRLKGLLEFCINRTNKNGLMEGYPKDWVFVDWADIDNTGEVCVEQMLYLVSLKYGAEFAEKAGDFESAKRWKKLADAVYPQIEKFWDNDRNAYVHSFKDGVRQEKITRYAAIFAILYDLCSEERKEILVEKTLLNESVQKLKTPYMRFYELAALCKAGKHEIVLNEIRNYWGGMIDEGATSFWELYNPEEKGAEKYAMYGRKYGKSLCHAWGASPVYLIGRYFAGCNPVGDGTYEVEPVLCGLKKMSVVVPTINGSISIDMTNKSLAVKVQGVDCKVIYDGKDYKLKSGEEMFAEKGNV